MESVIWHECTPEFGVTQPENGILLRVRLAHMGRRRKPLKSKGQLEAEVGMRLRSWMALALRKFGSETRQIEVLAKRSGVGKETIRKIIYGAQSARIDNLSSLATGLGRTLVELFSESIQEPEPARDSQNADQPTAPGLLQRR